MALIIKTKTIVCKKYVVKHLYKLSKDFLGYTNTSYKIKSNNKMNSIK